MNEKVTDQMLMAYVDGELDAQETAALERAIATDPELAARASSFRRSRQLTRDVFADLLAKEPPARLIEAIRKVPAQETIRETAQIIRFPMRRVAAVALPIAASIALVFGAGGYWWGQSSLAPGEVLGPSSVAAAMGEAVSGEERAITIAGGDATLTPLGTFETTDGLCRTFDVTGDALVTPLRGVACDRGGRWSVDMTVALAPGDGFAPASGGLVEAIEVYLDAMEAEGPLSAQEEAARGIGR